MKQVQQSNRLDFILQIIAKEFNLSPDEIREIYLALRSEEIKEEFLEAELIHQISEILNAIGVCDNQDKFEEESLPTIMGSVIYNIQSDEELEKLKDIEEARLNDGSAPIERIDVLEAQARAYFNHPNRHFYFDDESGPQVTGYISLYSHTLFDLNGKPVDFYKATGASFTLPISEVTSLDGIVNGVRSTGYELDGSIQVKLYGYALYDLVGAKPYKKEEATEFIQYFQESPSILFAIPDSQLVCDFQEGIYEALDRIVREEIIFGRTASDVLEGAYSNWCLAHEFYEVRVPEIEEEELALAYEEKVATRIKSKTQFRDSFTTEVNLIKSLNNKKCNLSDIVHLSAHEINRILYVCRSKDFSVRLESKSVYSQLQSMAHRKSQYEKHSLKTAA